MTDLSTKHLEDRMDKIEEKIDKILLKFDELPEKYITRREYEAAKEVGKEAKTDWARIITLIFWGIAMVLSLLKFK